MKLHFSISVVIWFLTKPSNEGFSPELLLHRILQPHSPLLQMQSEVMIREAQVQNGRLHLCYYCYYYYCHPVSPPSLSQHE